MFAELDDEAYGDMAATMRDLAGELEAPVLICLEGGYAPEALALSLCATIEALDGGPAPAPSPAAVAGPSPERARLFPPASEVVRGRAPP